MSYEYTEDQLSDLDEVTRMPGVAFAVLFRTPEEALYFLPLPATEVAAGRLCGRSPMDFPEVIHAAVPAEDGAHIMAFSAGTGDVPTLTN